MHRCTQQQKTQELFLEVYFIKIKMVNLSNLGQRLLIGRQSRVIVFVVDGLQLNFRVAPAGAADAVGGGGGLVGGQR